MSENMRCEELNGIVTGVTMGDRGNAERKDGSSTGGFKTADLLQDFCERRNVALKYKRRWNDKQMSEATSVMAALTLSGGMQDAYSYFLRGKVFANAQTGNIVLMGVGFFSGEFSTGLRYLFPVIFFALGVFTAEQIRVRFKGSRTIHWRQIIVALEILMLFLVGFMPLKEGVINLVANAITSFSCAMQVQAFRKVNGHAYASTMCIGNMRSGMEALSRFVSTKDREYLRKFGQYMVVILLFLSGAGLGGVLAKKMDQRMIWISCGLLLVSFLLMFIQSEEIEKAAAWQ